MEAIDMGFDSKFRESAKFYKLAGELFPYGTQLFSRRPELGPFGQGPVYFERGKDAHFWDIDGNEFVDTAMAKGQNFFWMTTPQIAARQIYQAITRKKKVAYVTRRWRLIAWLMKCIPDYLYHRL